MKAAHGAQLGDDVGGNGAQIKRITAIAGDGFQRGGKGGEADDIAGPGGTAIDQQMLAGAGVKVDLGFQPGPIVGDAWSHRKSMLGGVDGGGQNFGER